MDPLTRLTDALRCLPGVGPKSAQRMVFHLLQHQRERGLLLARCLEDAMQRLHPCQRCNNYTATELCRLCDDKTRQSRLLCVVETPADVAAIEQSGVYQGTYYILMNKISPLDGIGPDEIGLPRLQQLIISEQITEVILALSPNVEGQTTMHFIHEALHSLPIRISQLAHGIPAGGELEYLDSHTISCALRNRSHFDSPPR